MSRLRRRLTLPDHWASVRGLWLAGTGLHGAVLDEATNRIVLFEGVRVITADAVGWSVREIITCLSFYDTPAGVEPVLSDLCEADLQPLLACGALTRVDFLRLMAHVPGWEP